jgi:hypothetical protein
VTSLMLILFWPRSEEAYSATCIQAAKLLEGRDLAYVHILIPRANHQAARASRCSHEYAVNLHSLGGVEFNFLVTTISGYDFSEPAFRFSCAQLTALSRRGYRRSGIGPGPSVR